MAVTAHTSPLRNIILGKLQYYREGNSDKHLRDSSAMLDISGDQIDREAVARWAEELGVLDLWLKILAAMQTRLLADAESPPF